MTEQRRFRRVPFRDALSLGSGGYDEFQGTIGCDLSSGGVRIRAEQFMALGTPIRVKIQLNSGDILTLNGKVAWVQKEPYGEYYQLGVEFQEDTTDIFKRKRLQDYIEDEM